MKFNIILSLIHKLSRQIVNNNQGIMGIRMIINIDSRARINMGLDIVMVMEVIVMVEKKVDMIMVILMERITVLWFIPFLPA